MAELLDEQKFKAKLIDCLKLLSEMTQNSHLDFSQSFGRFKNSIEQSLVILTSSPNLTYEVLRSIASNLGFCRFYPLFELVDRVLQIQNRLLPQLIEEALRLRYWGLEEEKIKAHIEKKYPNVLKHAFCELTFRKGIKETEVESIKPIRFSMGNRLPEEYIYNLVRGWPYEDLVAAWVDRMLKRLEEVQAVKRESFAHDFDRVVRFESKPSGEANFKMSVTLKSGEQLTFYEEVQAVTDRSRRKNKVEVPPHRIEQSRKAGSGRYLIVLPYRSDKDPSGRSDQVAFVLDAHKHSQEEGGRGKERKTLVEATFIPPRDQEVEWTLQEILKAMKGT